jgi:hypothetical protein
LQVYDFVPTLAANRPIPPSELSTLEELISAEWAQISKYGCTEKTTCARQKQVIYPWISIEKGGVPCNRSRLPLSRIVGRIAHSKFYRLLLPFAVLLRQSEHKVK